MRYFERKLNISVYIRALTVTIESSQPIDEALSPTL